MLFQTQGIVVACDVPSLDDLEQLVHATGSLPEVTGFKLGFSLALRYGLPHVVSRMRAVTTKTIVYDHQKAGTDIPQTGSSFAEVCAESQVDGVIIFPHAGPATLEAWVKALCQHKLTPIVGAVMTHPHFLTSEGGYIGDDAARDVYHVALAQGVQHFVLPATRPEHAAVLIEEVASSRAQFPIILAPGVGRQKADKEAVLNAFRGLNWSPIIGSAIYGAIDPANQVLRMFSDLGLAG